MSDESNQQNGKNNRKQTIRVAVVSSFCALLLIAIILLLILFGLKNCSKGKVAGSSNDDQSSSQKYNYDNTKLDTVFKKIVFNQVFIDIGSEDPIDDIFTVSYSDTGSSFTLNIDAKIGDNIYYYFSNNVSYSGSPTFVDYLLTLNLDNNLPLIQGDNYGVSLLETSNERLTNEKSTSYVITNSVTSKYLSGYYFENNQYYVYQKVELNNTDAFPIEASKIIDIDNPLFGYYQELNNRS